MNRVAVAGAGIGGLAAALCLARAGFAVSVLEREEDLTAAGAGIQLSPNAVRILDRIGILPALEEAAAEPEAVELLDGRAGTLLAAMPLGAAARGRWGAPYLAAHRSDLQAALLDAAKRHPAIALELGNAVEDIAPDGPSLRIRTACGRAELAGAAIIADGVHSRLAAQLNRARRPQPTGFTAWRAVLAETAGLPGSAGAVRVFLAPDAHIVVYPPISPAGTNAVIVARSAAAGTAAERARSDLAASWARLHPELRASLLGAAESLAPWPVLAHRAPSLHRDAARWLAIGDAAHAMPPFAAQGAAMAIEDAWCAAVELARSPADPAAAFARTERARLPRLAKARLRGSFNRFAYHAAGPAAVLRDLVLARRSGESLMGDFDWLYGWQPPEMPEGMEPSGR